LEKRVQDKYELEKQRAIRDAEQAVWTEAEHLKAAALLKAREDSSIDLDRAIKKINRQHEKALKVSNLDTLAPKLNTNKHMVWDVTKYKSNR
jgi:mannose/cellobiose epimerase-like protein (N-acyl-D-glucosamine 2-epimerase family)